jgi:hypothetical protein
MEELGTTRRYRVSDDLQQALFNADRNRHISAVAVLEDYLPNQDLLDAAVKEHRAKRGTEDAPMDEIIQEVRQVSEEFFRVNPDMDMSLARPRVRILINSFADLKLPAGVFVGPRDERRELAAG